MRKKIKISKITEKKTATGVPYYNIWEENNKEEVWMLFSKEKPKLYHSILVEWDPENDYHTEDGIKIHKAKIAFRETKPDNADTNTIIACLTTINNNIKTIEKKIDELQEGLSILVDRVNE
jgi:hypothetical protein